MRSHRRHRSLRCGGVGRSASRRAERRKDDGPGRCNDGAIAGGCSIGPGMRVIDVGCGRGDVSCLVRVWWEHRVRFWVWTTMHVSSPRLERERASSISHESLSRRVISVRSRPSTASSTVPSDGGCSCINLIPSRPSVGSPAPYDPRRGRRAPNPRRVRRAR